jgi:hypothetical protein
MCYFLPNHIQKNCPIYTEVLGKNGMERGKADLTVVFWSSAFLSLIHILFLKKIKAPFLEKYPLPLMMKETSIFIPQSVLKIGVSTANSFLGDSLIG